MTGSAYPTDSRWTVLEGSHGGLPMFVRRNESAKALMESQDYPYRLGVAVALQGPVDLGLPSPDECETLAAIEDALCARLERDQLSLLVLTITTGGMREFVFYTRDADARALVQQTQAAFPGRKLTSYVRADAEWSLYDEFA